MSDLPNLSSKDTHEVPKNWFASWFDTPYYHILYKDRNYREAQVFMDNLTQYLNLPDHAKVLDLACGKGRHSVYLNKLGFDVIGADLSENSIAAAKVNENDTLHFEVHDMRLEMHEKFDAIFNLFTSFGYFENEQDNVTTLISIKNSLTPYGFAVIDFMNVQHVINNLVTNEVKTIEDITFTITRSYDEKYIYKEISFTDKGQDFNFTERVRALTLQDFTSIMAEANIDLLDIFGDYKLKKFHKTDSERLIMIFK